MAYPPHLDSWGMVVYDLVIGRDSLCRLFECDVDDLDIIEREIRWETMAVEYDQ